MWRSTKADKSTPVEEVISADEKPTNSDQPNAPSTEANEAPPAADPNLPQNNPQSKRRLGTLWTFSSVFLGVLWLAPIITLLVLNFKGYVAGAGVGCGVGGCVISPAFNETRQLDSRNHNILGALQLVAKALEVWFIFVAGALVYNLAMLLAKRDRGLPVRYLMTHKEFGDLAGLFSMSFWTTAFRRRKTKSTQDGHIQAPQASSRSVALSWFLIFVVVICIVSNLMGPATAVLLLPTLGWKAINIPQTQYFDHLAAPAAPRTVKEGDCTPEILTSGDYSCTGPSIAIPVDTMVANIAPSGSFFTPSYGVFSATTGFCTYYLNITYDGSPVLAPSRQTIGDLTEDWNEWWFSTLYDDAIEEGTVDPARMSKSAIKSMRNALQVERHREGPALSSSVQCYSTTTLISIAADKLVRCYDIQNYQNTDYLFMGYQMGSDLFEGGYTYPYPIRTVEAGVPMSTMCIRSGTGWSGAYAHSNFSIATFSDTADAWSVNIYSSDKAIYLDTSTSHCLTDTGNNVCDWNALFSAPIPDAYKSTSVNPLLTEYSLKDYATRWCRSFAYLKFPNYVLRTSEIGIQSAGQHGNVFVEDETPSVSADEAISVHPDWLLAAWSVSKEGIVNNLRPSAQSMMHLTMGEAPGDFAAFGRLHQVIVLNGLSMIDHSFNPINTSAKPDPNNLILKVSILTQVWSYGLESGTSKLGVVVAIAGCVIVLIYVVVAVKSRAVDRSLTDFMVVALEHEPPKVFVGLTGREPGRVLVKVENVKDWAYEFPSQQA